MDFSNYNHDGEEGFLTEQKENHWQPATGSDDDEMDQSATATPIASTSDYSVQPPNTTTTMSAASTTQPFSSEESDDEQQPASSQLDPAWGIKRTDSAHILETIHRSSSFPTPESETGHMLPFSQRLVRPSQVLRSQPEPQPAAQPTSLSDPKPESDSEPEQSEHSFAQTKPNDEEEQETLHNAHEAETLLQEEADEEDNDLQMMPDTSRFDEGVPLMMADQDPEQEMEQEDVARSPPTSFEINDSQASDGYFPRLSHTSNAMLEPRPNIERKETSEVLESLGMERGILDSPPPTDISAPEHSQAALAKEKDFAAAFGDDLAEDKDLVAAFAQNQEPEDDPWKAVLDNDEFLVEDADDLLPDSDEEHDAAPAPLPVRQPQQNPSTQRTSAFARTNSNPYAPHQPTTSELTQFGSTAQNVGFPHQPMQNPMGAFQTPQQPTITKRAASYVDQSKGGYKSPYDLPMDLAPKKRVQAQRPAPPAQNAPPPPRSSSISQEKQPQMPYMPNQPASGPSATASPIVHAGKLPMTSTDRSASLPVRPAQNTSKSSSSGFFEELPVVSRVRPTPAPRAPSAQLPPGPSRQGGLPSTGLVASPPQVQQSQFQQPHQTQDPYSQFQLQPPQKIDPYANVPIQSAQPPQPNLAPAPPQANPRYSPAPPTLQNGIKPPPSPRYSPAPPAQAAAGPRYSPAPSAQATGHNRYVSQPVGAGLPFQPRTSSPLAQHRNVYLESSEQQLPALHHASSSLPYNQAFQGGPTNPMSPPRASDPVKQDIMLPRRSQTQSPSRQMARSAIPPRIAPPPNRPASAIGQLSPTRDHAPQNVLSPPKVAYQARSYVQEPDFFLPVDGTERDELQRYKGIPIINFGFGGSVITTFPVRTPRFSASSVRPQIKASPGEVKIRRFDSILAPSDTVAKFPGPLKGKAKKKDVLTWLVSSISGLEQVMMTQPSKRLEEKLALWKIVNILVEHDGNLESQQAVSVASAILMPDVYVLEEPAVSQYGASDPSPGLYRPASFTAKSEAVDPVAVDRLRKTLLKGNREDAVWQAVDNRLWSHAMLLASTLDKKVWKSVVAEFVKQEVKTMGASADSLCALYEVLGGNTEESVDQLVPPSARAGLQMVSKVEASGPIRNALDGLDRWKETLCLILNNRSVEDQRALITLARLLTDYGRIEAAHICYLFARSLAIPHMFGGADDANTMVVLLGADHRSQPLNFHLDTDSIMLTEVYEFAISTLAQGATGTPMPHMTVYKLQRAKELADVGMKTEAQAYCDAMESGFKSSTRHSLYYNPILLGEVQELSNRVKQIPVQSASWIGKPSIEKVSGSVWNKFSSFVTGEDSDAESKDSARIATEAGPFAKVSGSPTLSRNASQTDLYSSYPAATQMTPATASTSAGSRYAPNGISSARSSSEITRGRTSLDYQRSPPTTSNPPRNSLPGYQPSPTAQQPSPEPPMYMHMPSVTEESLPPANRNTYAPYQNSEPSQGDSDVYGMQPVQPAFGGYVPEISQLPEQPQHETQSSPFEPPTNDTSYGGYAPPDEGGYQPYVPDVDSDSEEKSKPKKKSFMDDDDEEFLRVSKRSDPPAPSSNTGSVDDGAAKARKRANDDAANAAFLAAAEADAARAKDAASSKKTGSGSWLGGWFAGSKKQPDSLDAGDSSKSKGADQKVHRVHLGESKMKLYYDKDKKKWINPDNPEATEKKSAPPPPRASTGSAPPGGSSMGPPRSVSTPMSLPAGGISRSGTPMSQAIDTASEGGDSRPGTGYGNGHAPPSGIAAMLPPGTAQSLGLGEGSKSLPVSPTPNSGPSGPPSRPASALSNASGLDDLLGGPPSAGGRKVSGRAAKGKKGRYVDVMAQ